jgi:hypothetical protein
MAGLLAIAVLGAVISARFAAIAGGGVSGGPLTVQAAAASTSAFHLGIGIAGALMIAGGVVSGLGIQNRGRAVDAFPTRGAATAGECGHGADADCGSVAPEPARESV